MAFVAACPRCAQVAGSSYLRGAKRALSRVSHDVRRSRVARDGTCARACKERHEIRTESDHAGSGGAI